MRKHGRTREIIIVNDGSTDNSAELAQSYADRYPHVHLLHQRNGGVSAARNTGMKVAGEYIAYVDGDDIAYPEMYETLMTMALKDNPMLRSATLIGVLRKPATHGHPFLPIVFVLPA